MSSPSAAELQNDSERWAHIWNDSDLFSNCERIEDVQEPDCFLMICEDDEVDAKQVLSSVPTSIQCTPGKENNSLISSPQFHTPSCAADVARPFSACNESPIDLCLVAASTPFQGQRISSTSSACSDQLKKCELYTEAKFDNPGECKNETFNASAHPVDAGDATFNKDKNLTFCKEENVTFDVKPVEKDSGSDIMDSCSRLESSGESHDGKPQRKPLTAIPQPKTVNTSRTGLKKMSRLALPRMNAAAMSRIQARSPGSASAQNASDLMKPPASRSLRKTTTSGNIMRARKSLLPPANPTKSSISTKKSNNNEVETAMVSEHSETSATSNKPNSEVSNSAATPTKRKAQQSPKRVGRSPKISGANAAAVPPRIANTLRSSSAPISRLAAGTARTSRLQRPPNFKASSSSRLAPHPAGSRLPDTKASLRTVTKTCSRPSSNQNGPALNGSKKTCTSALNATGNLRKPKPRPKNTNVNNKGDCVTGLAILLDYVVNKLDGLSAPRLTEDKQQLQKLVNDKEEANGSLSSRVEQLETSLVGVKEEYKKTTKEASERHLQELEEERKCRERMVNQLSSDLETERKQIVSLRLEHEEMKTNHEAEMTQMLNDMEFKIQEELGERMKPYLNAKSEVESLTAVLEMKNDTIHKLEAQSSKYDVQRDEVLTLQYKIERLEQKNEDLTMQLQEKIEENRSTAAECEKLRRSMSEQHNRSIKLHQHNEELMYRLNSVSPSPSSPFNPVFTTSPTIADPPCIMGALGSTPINAGMKRTAYSKSASASKSEDQSPKDNFPRSLSYNNNSNNENGLNHSL